MNSKGLSLIVIVALLAGCAGLVALPDEPPSISAGEVSIPPGANWAFARIDLTSALARREGSQFWQEISFGPIGPLPGPTALALFATRSDHRLAIAVDEYPVRHSESSSTARALTFFVVAVANDTLGRSLGVHVGGGDGANVVVPIGSGPGANFSYFEEGVKSARVGVSVTDERPPGATAETVGPGQLLLEVSHEQASGTLHLEQIRIGALGAREAEWSWAIDAAGGHREDGGMISAARGTGSVSGLADLQGDRFHAKLSVRSTSPEIQPATRLVALSIPLNVSALTATEHNDFTATGGIESPLERTPRLSLYDRLWQRFES